MGHVTTVTNLSDVIIGNLHQCLSMHPAPILVCKTPVSSCFNHALYTKGHSLKHRQLQGYISLAITLVGSCSQPLGCKKHTLTHGQNTTKVVPSMVFWHSGTSFLCGTGSNVVPSSAGAGSPGASILCSCTPDFHLTHSGTELHPKDGR